MLSDRMMRTSIFVLAIMFCLIVPAFAALVICNNNETTTNINFDSFHSENPNLEFDANQNVEFKGNPNFQKVYQPRILENEPFWGKIDPNSLKDVKEFRSWIIKDVPGDGRCGYWAILQSFWNELANPDSVFSQQFWTIDERKDVNYQDFVNFDKMKAIKQELSGILGKYIDIIDFIVKTRVERQNINSGDLVLFMKYKMIVYYYNESSMPDNKNEVANMNFVDSQSDVVSDKPNKRFKELIENEALYIDEDLLILVAHAFNIKLYIIALPKEETANPETTSNGNTVSVHIHGDSNDFSACLLLSSVHYSAVVQPVL